MRAPPTPHTLHLHATGTAYSLGSYITAYIQPTRYRRPGAQFMLTDLVRGQFFSRSRAFLKAMSSGENATSSSVEPMSIEAPGASEAGSGSPVATSPPDPEQRSAASSGHRLGSDAEPDDQEDTVSKRLTRLQLNSKSGDPEAEVRFLSLAPPIPPPSPPAWRHADQRCVHLRLRHRRPLKSPPS